jgi:hypothetical protein
MSEHPSETNDKPLTESPESGEPKKLFFNTNVLDAGEIAARIAAEYNLPHE